MAYHVTSQTAGQKKAKILKVKAENQMCMEMEKNCAIPYFKFCTVQLTILLTIM